MGAPPLNKLLKVRITMMTKAETFLNSLDEMAQTGKIGSTATSVKKVGDNLTVKYHDTVVVNVTKDKIVLDTGGWKTNTTKTRMNQASNEYDLGYQVYQKKGHWLVDWRGETVPFDKTMLTLKK